MEASDSRMKWINVAIDGVTLNYERKERLTGEKLERTCFQRWEVSDSGYWLLKSAGEQPMISFIHLEANPVCVTLELSILGSWLKHAYWGCWQSS